MTVGFRTIAYCSRIALFAAQVQSGNSFTIKKAILTSKINSTKYLEVIIDKVNLKCEYPLPTDTAGIGSKQTGKRAPD